MSMQQPTLFNGATQHGINGIRPLRHPKEMPLFWWAVAFTVLAYALWWVVIALLISGEITLSNDPESDDAAIGQVLAFLSVMPIFIWVGRAVAYARPRVTGVRMSPTQFPEGYRMVAESAAMFGLRRVPDAYVVAGNGVINAYASGHGFRRFIVVHSDIFEVGGEVRDPDALRFVIGHEVGHLAAGHVSYFRLLWQLLMMQVPFLGSALSRAQEYTADNHGFAYCANGATGVVGLLSAGKYLNADVNLHEFADRASHESGFWVHLYNALASHPVLTWRAAALRDRSVPGRLLIRPRTPWFRGPLPTGAERTALWPTPTQILDMLGSAEQSAPRPPQFGRYPGVDYSAQGSARHTQHAVPVFAQQVGGPFAGHPGTSGPNGYTGSAGPSEPYGPTSTN